MSQRIKISILLLFLLISFAFPLFPASAQAPVIRAVLFYSPTCPVCHEIMGQFLPPYIDQYGDQLQILTVDVTTMVGQTLYQQAVQQYQITENRLGVPTMIVSSVVMVGGYEIPDYFPTILETGLVADGYAWPEIPGLTQVINEGEFPFLGEEGSLGYEVSIFDRFNQDPVANSLSVLVLIGMIYSMYRMLGFYYSSGRKNTPELPDWIIPIIAVIGLAVSGYLSFIEVSHNEAFCGPVGNCNAVQQSDYALLFGVIPVGILGIVAYIVLLGAWFVQKYGGDRIKQQAVQLMWLITITGTIFSIYLTYLEPFVIGATCIWCITSAIAMTVLLWLTTYRSIEVKRNLRRRHRRV